MRITLLRNNPIVVDVGLHDGIVEHHSIFVDNLDCPANRLLIVVSDGHDVVFDRPSSTQLDLCTVGRHGNLDEGSVFVPVDDLSKGVN